MKISYHWYLPDTASQKEEIAIYWAEKHVQATLHSLFIKQKTYFFIPNKIYRENNFRTYSTEICQAYCYTFNVIKQLIG